jgi:hypothetical protein
MALIRITTKRSKKRKPNAKDRALQAEWERLLKSHSKPLEKGAKANGLKATRREQTPGITVEVCHLQSSSPSQEAFAKMQGSTAPRSSSQYTGTAMLGTAAMHKSNEVPVFSKEEAVDISKMRRG